LRGRAEGPRTVLRGDQMIDPNAEYRQGKDEEEQSCLTALRMKSDGRGQGVACVARLMERLPKPLRKIVVQIDRYPSLWSCCWADAGTGRLILYG